MLTTVLSSPPAAASPDIQEVLLNVESGLYAILQMTDRSFSSLIEADRARSGISYVATKLERDLRVVLDHLDSEPRPVAAI